MVWEKKMILRLEGGETIETRWGGPSILPITEPGHMNFTVRPGNAGFDIAIAGLTPGKFTFESADYLRFYTLQAEYEIKPGLIKEVICDGTVYRVWARFDALGRYVQVNGEPIGQATTTAAKPTVPEQILEMLERTPEGMTAPQIAAKLDCHRSHVFRGLAALAVGGKIEKRGGLYLFQKTG